MIGVTTDRTVSALLGQGRAALEGAGIRCAKSPADMGSALAAALKG